MRTLLTLAALVAIPASAAAQDTDTDVINRRITVGDAAELTLTNVSGDITVTGGDGREIIIQATKRGGDREARDQIEVEIQERGNRVEVRARYPRDGRRRGGRVRVEYDVQVPRGTEVSVKTVSGGVRLDQVDGETRAETVSGDVEITAARQLSHAKSVSGDITVTGSSAEPELQAQSVSGSIEATDVSAGRLTLSAVSGDVMLAGVTSREAHITSVSGDVEYGGALAADGRYELQSHSGDVRVLIAEEVGFDVDASTFSGRIRTDLSIIMAGVDIDSRRRRSLEGRFGEGVRSWI